MAEHPAAVPPHALRNVAVSLQTRCLQPACAGRLPRSPAHRPSAHPLLPARCGPAGRLSTGTLTKPGLAWGRVRKFCRRQTFLATGTTNTSAKRRNDGGDDEGARTRARGAVEGVSGRGGCFAASRARARRRQAAIPCSAALGRVCAAGSRAGARGLQTAFCRRGRNVAERGV